MPLRRDTARALRESPPDLEPPNTEWIVSLEYRLLQKRIFVYRGRRPTCSGRREAPFFSQSSERLPQATLTFLAWAIICCSR